MSSPVAEGMIVLPAELADRVRAVAERQGLAPEAALSRLVEVALAEDERKFQETAAALRASLADAQAADSVALEDWRAQSQAWVASHWQAA